MNIVSRSITSAYPVGSVVSYCGAACREWQFVVTYEHADGQTHQSFGSAMLPTSIRSEEDAIEEYEAREMG